MTGVVDGDAVLATLLRCCSGEHKVMTVGWCSRFSTHPHTLEREGGRRWFPKVMLVVVDGAAMEEEQDDEGGFAACVGPSRRKRDGSCDGGLFDWWQQVVCRDGEMCECFFDGCNERMSECMMLMICEVVSVKHR